MKTINKQVKTCLILTRVFVKATKSIVCIVRNGENKIYQVALNANGTSTCINHATGEQCKGTLRGRKCYHITNCQSAEANRVAAQPACVVAAYDVVTEAVKVAARALALPLDAYEVLATTKHVSHVTYCSECGKLSKSGLCGRCAWGC